MKRKNMKSKSKNRRPKSGEGGGQAELRTELPVTPKRVPALRRPARRPAGEGSGIAEL
jgi:hypothetical protein